MVTSRYDNAYQDDLHPDLDLEDFGNENEDPYGGTSLPVRIVDDGNIPNHKVQQGFYQTVLIPASTSTVVSWQQLLPRDPMRGYAYIMPVDYPIVISTELPEVQSANNIGGTFPNGGYIGSGFSPAIRHKEAVYAANTSTAGSCRVVVMIDRGAE